MKLPPQPWLHAPALRDQALAGAVVAAVTLAFYWSPLLPLTVLLGAALLYLFWQRLDLGLLVVLASAPFYRFPKLYDQGGLGALLGREGALEVSLAESALILCLLAWGLRRFFPPDIDAAATGKSPFTDPAVWLPPAVLIAAAVVTLPFTEHLSVALREFRVVVVGPSLYYLMLVHTLRKEQDVGTFMWALALLGGGIGLYSLYHYLFVGVVESTGGVDRVLAVYHSPNALALFLGRVIPVAAALMLAVYAQQACKGCAAFLEASPCARWRESGADGRRALPHLLPGCAPRHRRRGAGVALRPQPPLCVPGAGRAGRSRSRRAHRGAPGPPPGRSAASATAVRVAGCASYGRGPSYRGCGPR